jgi:hypothetical protein
MRYSLKFAGCAAYQVAADGDEILPWSRWGEPRSDAGGVTIGSISR